MFKRILVLFFLSTFYFGFSQSETIAVEQINKIIAKSGAHLTKLECDKSLALAKTALEKAILINNNELIARSYNIIGLNLDEYYDFKNAIFFFNKGLEYANKTQSDFIKYSLHNNIARTLSFRKIDYKKGIYHYKMGLYYAKLLKDDYEIMYANLNITTGYFSIEEYSKGLPYLKSAEKAVESGEELEAKISFYSLLGAYYSYKNNYIDSEKSYKRALQFCGENKTEFLEGNATEVYDDISRMYSKKGDFKTAYFYIDKYNSLKEKQYVEENLKLERTSGMSSVLDEYKRKIEKIEQEKLIQNNNLEQARIVGILFIIIFLVLLLLIITYYKSYIYKKQSNKRLVASYRELNKTNKQLTRVSILKSQFVSTISHELRTPLYGVVGISDILIAEYPILKNSTYINSLKFSANYLLSLVNDVLEISKIENKNIVLEDITFNIFEEMDSILGTINVLFKINHNTVEFDIDENIPKQLIGDKNRLSQILINLLGNSLKFTKEGKVTLMLRLIKKDVDSSVIEFEVKDTGVGIAFENQSKIFDKFVQLNESKDMYQGSGLGLSIVQKLINLFNSKIYLQSELGKGTQFNFSIEFKNGSVEDSKLLDYEVSYDLFSGHKVLIVEDNKINQFVTKKLLEKIDFECHIAENGFDALEILKKENFDLILMDINMPGLNGFETTIKIRQSNITTPIIALTAFSKLEVEKDSIDSGMNAIVIKPYEFSELYSIISYLVDKKNAD